MKSFKEFIQRNRFQVPKDKYKMISESFNLISIGNQISIQSKNGPILNGIVTNKYTENKSIKLNSGWIVEHDNYIISITRD